MSAGSYPTACALICAVADGDDKAADLSLFSLSRAGLESLAVTLAAMVPADHVPHPSVVLNATQRIIKDPPSVLPKGLGEIVWAVAESLGMDDREILSASRQADVVKARQIVCWLAYTCEHLSYPVIGKAIRRDHTTVMYAVQKVNSTAALRTRAGIIARQMGQEVAA